MEMMKPEVKKKPKPPRPLPKPSEVKRNETEILDKPTPGVPERPTDAELSHTQYRVKRAVRAIDEANGHLRQKDTKEKSSETPAVPTRPTEKELNATTRNSHRRREQAQDTKSSRANNQSEAPTDEADFKQSNQSALTGMFKRSQKEKAPTFTAYVTHNLDKEEKSDNTPAKQATGSKQGGLKEIMKGLQIKSSAKASKEPSPNASGEEEESEREKPGEKNKQEKNAEPKQGGLKEIMKGLQIKSSAKGFDKFLSSLNSLMEDKDAPSKILAWLHNGPQDSHEASKEPSPNASGEEEDSEREQPGEKNKKEKNAEPKQEFGALFAGMFKKTPKDRSTSPAVTVSKADSDAEETGEEEGKTIEEKGGFFTGIRKKTNKTRDENEDNLKAQSELSASCDSLSENKEKGGIFSGMFKKPQKPSEGAKTDEDQQSLNDDLSGSNDNLSENSKEKGGFFSGILRKSPKIPADETSEQDKQSLSTDPSDSNETLSENSGSKEKANIFSGMFKKSPKPSEGPRLEEGAESLHGELSASTDSLSENKEKGGLFSGLLKKTPKTAEEENLSAQKELSASNDSLSEPANTKEKEKGSAFSGLFKKSSKPADSPPTEEEEEKELSASDDDVSESKTTKEKNIFSNMFKKPQKPAEGAAEEKNLLVKSDKELSGSSENLSEAAVPKEKKGGLGGIFKRSASIENLFDEEKGGLFSGLRKKAPKATGDDAAEEDKDEQKELKASTENLSENGNTKEKSIFSGMFKKTPKAADGNTTDDELDPSEDKKLSSSTENLLEASKEKTGGLAGIFKRSPKPSPRSIATKDPLSNSKEMYGSCDSLNDTAEDELTASNDNLSETTGITKERRGGFGGRFRRNKTLEHQESEDMEPPEGGGLRRRRTIKKKRRVVSFRVKKTLPKLQKLNAQNSEKMPLIEETVELQDLNPAPENSVEVETVEMAAYPTDQDQERLKAEEENDELMEWWNTVKGWTEWNETSNFTEEDEQMAIEQAADRVYMAARLFVRLFNQRGASLQHRILELLALADAADQFHKKTVSVAVGGGVASVAGSVATITGLILAPFTFGASIIVTAVGIGVATAGSITSATANITDTVHSNMDRKKLEKMIQGYQEEIKDIREIMEFVQAGMDTLQEWDFEKYSQSAAKKAMNHNLKHVMKEGGRAGKALMINTDKLISTVQVLGAAGGAAKAASAISVTTGVMSALFLALDVFFLAKDSHELRKGAKTKFARKIRDVCKELQDGLLELNKVKTQLQKTMDGIEVEEFEEIEEVEVEVEDDFESDPKKLAELEQELDIMEEKLDNRIEEEQRRKREMEEEEKKKKQMAEEEKKKKEMEVEEKKKKEMEAEEDKKKEMQMEMETLKRKKEKKEETSMKEKEPGDKKDKEEDDKKGGSEMEPPDEKKEQKNDDSKEEIPKEKSQKVKKMDKETENRITAEKEKYESKSGKIKHEEEKEKNKTDKTHKDIQSRSADSKRDHRSETAYSERGSERKKSSRDSEEETKPEWKSGNKESGNGTRRHSSRSDKEGPHWRERASRNEVKETKSWRRMEEERGVKDRRAETTKSREEKRETEREAKREDHRKGDSRSESHRSHESRREHSERERGSGREESGSKRSHHRRGSDEQREGAEDKRGSRIESARRKFERAGDEGREEEERGKRREERERRGSERDREHRHSHRGSQSRANALLEDGLYI